DVVLDLRQGRGVDVPEDVVVDAATELRPHRPLAGRRAEDDVDRLLHVGVARAEREPAEPVDPDGEGDPGADDVRHRLLPYPRLIWVPEMEMLPTGVRVILAVPHLISSCEVPSIEIAVPPLIVTLWLPSIVMSPFGFCSTLPVVSTVRSLSDLIVITSFACIWIFLSDCSE